jgi:hypothetical protein
MTDKWPKYVEYRGITFRLGKYGELRVQYSYRLDKHIGGMGFSSEDDARKDAEAAIDRMLAREAVK